MNLVEQTATEKNSQQVSASRSEIAALIDDKKKELKDLLQYYINAFAIYSGITGALAKFALDKDATIEQRKVLIVFGLAISCLGIAICALGAILRRDMIKDIKDLNVTLGLPETPSSYLPLKFMTVGALVFVIFCLVGWIYLLR